jgi:hypothetical protein
MMTQISSDTTVIKTTDVNHVENENDDVICNGTIFYDPELDYQGQHHPVNYNNFS